MKTTLKIPDAIDRRVKSKSSLDGRPVREVTQRLYELWLEGNIVLDDPARLPVGGGREHRSPLFAVAHLSDTVLLTYDNEVIDRAAHIVRVMTPDA